MYNQKMRYIFQSLDDSLNMVENTKIKVGQDKRTTAEKVNEKLQNVIEKN